jgi:hypothetical protein
MPLRIANGAGFLGDSLTAPRRLVEAARVDYLTLEYLAELTMSILARAREKDASAGYATDFIDVLASLTTELQKQPQLKIVTNAGGMNPQSCAREAANVLTKAGLSDVRIGVVSGDDLLPQLPSMRAADQLLDMDGKLCTQWPDSPFVSANAYLGARPFVEALAAGARIVITGRVADASLTVGPAMHELGGDWNDWNRLAAFSVVGHLIECGAQVTGGYSTRWADFANLAAVGYPIAEIEADGSTVITKPDGSGGAVTRRTVIEQLTYEIGDPAHYLTPDVDVDFTTVTVEEVGRDRVLVRGAAGRPATDTYKLSAAYRDGFLAAGELLVYGEDAVGKAHACAEMILKRVAAAGFSLARTGVELLGVGSAAGFTGAAGAREVVLRVAAHDANRAAVERFTKEFAPLITGGPAGLAGYASGRPTIRSVFAYLPLLVPKPLVSPQIAVHSAADLLRQPPEM